MRYGGGLGSDRLYWGVTQSPSGATTGQNNLGVLLEKVRNSCLNDCEVEDWIRFSAVNLIDCDKRVIPSIELEVYKEGDLIETITLENKELFVFGRNEIACNVHLLHESISGVHAVFVIDKEKGATLIDLGSEYGTTLNGVELEQNVPAQIK